MMQALAPTLKAHHSNPVKYTRPYRQSVALQLRLMDKSAEPDVQAHALAALARAFCDLEETKRKLRMKPLPKSIDVTKLPRNQKRQAGPSFTEQQGD